MGFIGGILVHLAALYAVMGTIVGTCTMGAADELAIGPIVCAPLYLLGFTLLIIHPLRVEHWLAMCLAVMAIIYQAYWSMRFAILTVIYSLSACTVLKGSETYVPDGREIEFIVLWLGMSALAAIGLGWAWIRTQRRYRLSSSR